jgi:hypothetical protein
VQVGQQPGWGEGGSPPAAAAAAAAVAAVGAWM